jgi:hypothetical protein
MTNKTQAPQRLIVPDQVSITSFQEVLDSLSILHQKVDLLENQISHSGSHKPISVNKVADLFECSPRTVSIIPKDELPVYRGPGRRNFYLMDDLIDYLRRRPTEKQITDDLIQKVLYLPVDGSRRRTHKENTHE